MEVEATFAADGRPFLLAENSCDRALPDGRAVGQHHVDDRVARLDDLERDDDTALQVGGCVLLHLTHSRRHGQVVHLDRDLVALVGPETGNKDSPVCVGAADYLVFGVDAYTLVIANVDDGKCVAHLARDMRTATEGRH